MTTTSPKALFGVNACYLRGSYGHDLAPNPRFPDWPAEFDPMDAYRVLIEAQRLGLGAVRIWLCENAEGILVEDGNVVGVHQELLDAIQVFQEAAHLNGIKLYPSLLDGNAWPREEDPFTRSILTDADQSKRFAEHVVAPIAKLLDSEVTLALEIVNEPETSAASCMKDSKLEPIEWSDIGRAIRIAGEAARSEREMFITAGTMHQFLPQLWRAGAALNAIDVHVYHPHGGLPSRDELADYVEDDALRDTALPLIGGELGIPKEAQEDGSTADPMELCHYIHNADRLDYSAAFLWQLEGDLYDKNAPRRPATALAKEVAHTLGVIGR
ncbi:MAG: hypothetical protein AB8H86_32895 [Polyangiales bacterium]